MREVTNLMKTLQTIDQKSVDKYFKSVEAAITIQIDDK